MQTTHAMLPWAGHDGRNADDVISARRPAVLLGKLVDNVIVWAAPERGVLGGRHAGMGIIWLERRR
jgi:hypothetical protein